MPRNSLAKILLLPDLHLVGVRRRGRGGVILVTERVSSSASCSRCGAKATGVYDRRTVRIRDEPIARRPTWLVVRKRRFRCPACRRVFTESVPGIRPRFRTTERFRKLLFWAYERFSDLKSIRTTYRCSTSLLARVVYEQLDKKRRDRLCAWPPAVGIDEHFFRSEKGWGGRRFVTVFTDHSRRRLTEVVDGKDGASLEGSLGHIPGADQVRWVVIDMCDPYKRFSKQHFPNATIVADKFHVLRLPGPALIRYLKLAAPGRQTLPVSRLLRRNRHRLEPWMRDRLDRFLVQHPALAAVYAAKEALHRLYRNKSYDRAHRSLTHLTDTLALSTVPELKTLRRTLMRWRREILAYFRSRLTNARTEGFNAKAKLVKRRGYGYRSFDNYRLALLNACS
jgi:transposase